MAAPVITGSRPRGTTSHPPSAPSTPHGQFRMWRVGSMDDRDWSLWCLLGGERPKPTRGYGGWGQTQRTGRRAVSTFDGSDLPAFTIALIIEDTRTGGPSTAAKMRALERLCGWDAADDDPPPKVSWVANVAHDYLHTPSTRWRVESLEWGDDHADDSGRLVWIQATVVVGLVRDPAIKVKAAKGFARATLSKGHDLRQFARTNLGDPKRWRDVAELNRDNPKCPQTPTVKAKRDVVLLVPPRED